MEVFSQQIDDIISPTSGSRGGQDNAEMSGSRNPSVMLISQKAVALGLNLVPFNHVFLVSFHSILDCGLLMGRVRWIRMCSYLRVLSAHFTFIVRRLLV
jgi:hypothetical protein